MIWNGFKICVGMSVKLTDTRPSGWNSSGHMDHYLGQEVIVTRISDDRFFTTPDETNENRCWIFKVSDIVAIGELICVDICEKESHEALTEA